MVSIPISALNGDNVVTNTDRIPWYEGPSLLKHLETVPIRQAAVAGAVRIPVQCVIRPDANFRGFGGQIASGTIRPGRHFGGAAVDPEEPRALDRDARRGRERGVRADVGDADAGR